MFPFCSHLLWMSYEGTRLWAIRQDPAVPELPTHCDGQENKQKQWFQVSLQWQVVQYFPKMDEYLHSTGSSAVRPFHSPSSGLIPISGIWAGVSDLLIQSLPRQVISKLTAIHFGIPVLGTQLPCYEKPKPHGAVTCGCFSKTPCMLTANHQHLCQTCERRCHLSQPLHAALTCLQA